MNIDPATQTPVTDAQTLVRVTYRSYPARPDARAAYTLPLAADSYQEVDVLAALETLLGSPGGWEITAIEVLRWPASAANNPWTDVLPAEDDTTTELAVPLFGNSGFRRLRWPDEKLSGYRLNWERTEGVTGPVEFSVTRWTGGNLVASGMDLAQAKIWIQEQGLRLDSDLDPTTYFPSVEPPAEFDLDALTVDLFGPTGSRKILGQNGLASGFRLDWHRSRITTGPVEFVVIDTTSGNAVVVDMDLLGVQSWMRQNEYRLM